MSKIKRISFVFVFWTILSTTVFAVESGDPAKFALRFDDQTGNPVALVYKGEPITLSGAGVQPFDLMQDSRWVFGNGKLELVKIEKKSDSETNVTQRIGDWTVVTRYTIHSETATLGRKVELIFNGRESTKIRGFWMALPIVPFENDARFLVPGIYPPKMFTPTNFNVGAKQGLWKDSAPLVLQLDPTKSLLLLSDQLDRDADRPGGDVYREEEGLRLVQVFNAQGHVKPGARNKQRLGTAYLRIVDGDAESALLKMVDFRRDLGHVVPKDRPEWFRSAILYSFHPGGTTGSNCKDMGGFIPATKHLDRIADLGCNAIWLMPLEDKSIYWPRDYYKLQDGLGSTPEKADSEYKTLVAHAHELGLKVLQDSVPHGGSNTNDRAKEHPYWLAQEEDGSTHSYWCFDFNWPSWIDYMAGVSRFYMNTYKIDGFRIDACSGSRIPNWNPEIPYARASHAQSQGGLNMVRAIRKAVKSENPDGATLAEVSGCLFGAVSDAVYDFDLCYHVLHDVRKLPPEEFVKRIRRWLHEQQHSEIPDLLRLRHVESHDSLRAQLWYGTRTHRKLMALTAYIHGLPLVYHDEEIGHGPEFRTIFETRKALPELSGGDADYLSVNAPPGVFACLRGKDGGASVVLIDFNENEDENENANKKGIVWLPWDSLPADLRSQNAVYCREAGSNEGIRRIEESGDVLRLPFDGCRGPARVYVLRKSKEDFEKNGLSDRLNAAATVPQTEINRDKPDLKSFDHSIRLDIPSGDSQHILFVDPETGLPAGYFANGFPVFGDADILLSPDYLGKAEKPTIDHSDRQISVRRKCGAATLEIDYTADKDGLHIATRWTGEDIPRAAALSLTIFQPTFWNVNDLSYRQVPPRPFPEGFYGSIYWRPQGTDIFYDSVQDSFVAGRGTDSPAMSFTSRNGGERFCIDFGAAKPIRVREQGPIGDKEDVRVLLSWADTETPRVDAEKPAFSLRIGRVPGAATTPAATTATKKRSAFREAAGGWVYENDFYRLRITRSGTIMSLHSKEKDGTQKEIIREIIRESDVYTDYGYGTKNIRYAAGHDVEAGIRIARDEDGTLRLRCEGQLRGTYRFDLMRPPTLYFTEYALNDGPVVALSCGVRTPRLPTDSKGFLALMVPLPRVDAFEYFKDGKQLAAGSNLANKGRSFECQNGIPDRVVLKNGDKTLLELREIDGAATNLFLADQNFFITFDDNERIGRPNTWRTLSANLYCSQRPADISVPKRVHAEKSGTTDAVSTDGNLIVNGGFEAMSGDNDLVALRTEAVLKGLRKAGTSWTDPVHGRYSTSEFHGGKVSAQVDGEAEQYHLFNQTLDLEKIRPGQKLRLAAWVKGRDLKQGPLSWQVACLRFAYWIEGSGQTHYVATPALTGTFDWKPVFIDWTVPEKLSAVNIQVGNNGGTGTVWIDDVTLEIQPPGN